MLATHATRLPTMVSAVLAAAASLAALPATADVTIEERVAMDGFGPAKIGAMEGTTTTAISPDRARIDSQIQFKSRLLRALGGKGGSAQIIRLDSERQLELDLDKKQYTELSFEDFRANAKAALAGAEAQATESAETAPSGAPVNESQCEWSPAKADVRRPGTHAQLAGFDTEQAVITVSQTCTDKQTKAACEFVYSIDQWLAPGMPGGPQAQAFWLAYARKLGSDEMTSAMQMRARQVFSRYKDGWGEALKSAGKLEGYPLKTTFTMQVGGPTCAQSTSTSAATPGEPGVLPSAGEAAAEAGAQSAASVATSVAAQKAAEEAGGSIAGGIAGSAAGAFGGKLTSGLMNKMRKKTPEPAAAATPDAPASTMTQLFRMTTETLSVRDAAIPRERFEVPVGFKKVER